MSASNLFAAGKENSLETTTFTSHSRIFSLKKDRAFVTTTVQFSNPYQLGSGFSTDPAQISAIYDSMSVGISIPIRRHISFITDFQCFRLSVAAKRDFVIPIGFRINF